MDGTQPIQGWLWGSELWASAREDLEEVWATAKEKHGQGISNLMAKCLRSEGKTIHEGVGASGVLRDRKVEIMAPSQREKRKKPFSRKLLISLFTCPAPSFSSSYMCLENLS